MRRLNLWSYIDKMYWKYVGRMPHNWIQDPRSIPPEVIDELERDLEQIPPDLWDYSETFPARMPSRLRPLVQTARERWRKDFIDKRREIFIRRAATDPSIVEQEWREEQERFAWLYGPNYVPLFNENEIR